MCHEQKAEEVPRCWNWNVWWWGKESKGKREKLLMQKSTPKIKKSTLNIWTYVLQTPYVQKAHPRHTQPGHTHFPLLTKNLLGRACIWAHNLLKPISHRLTRILKNFRNFPNTDTDYGDLNIANSTIRLNFAEQLYEPSPSKKKVGPCGKLPPEGQLARQKYSGLVRKK